MFTESLSGTLQITIKKNFCTYYVCKCPKHQHWHSIAVICLECWVIFLSDTTISCRLAAFVYADSRLMSAGLTECNERPGHHTQQHRGAGTSKREAKLFDTEERIARQASTLTVHQSMLLYISIWSFPGEGCTEAADELKEQTHRGISVLAERNFWRPKSEIKLYQMFAGSMHSRKRHQHWQTLMGYFSFSSGKQHTTTIALRERSSC